MTLSRAGSFAVAALIPFGLALRNGGYDLVDHQVAALGLWWAIALALAFGVLPAVQPARDLRPAAIALAALVSLTALALLWTESAEATAGELARLLGYAGVVLLVWTGVGRADWRAAAGGLTLGALAICALAVAARALPDLFSDPPGALSLDGRLAYPLGYWNAVGAWGAMAAALGLGWSVAGRSPLVRGIALAFVPVAGLTVHLSFSRAAAAAALVALALTVALARDRRRTAENAAAAIVGFLLALAAVRVSPEISRGSGGAGGGLVLAALGLAALGCAMVARRPRLAGGPRASRANTFALASAIVGCGLIAAVVVIGPRVVAVGDEGLAVGDYPAFGADPAARLVSDADPRPQIWAEALDATASAPFQGIGPGTFGSWWSREEGSPSLRDAHSVFFDTAAELGVPGVLALLALLGSLLWAGLRALWRCERSGDAALLAALLAAFAAYLVVAGVDWLWEVPAVTVLALIAAALAGAQPGEARRRSRIGPLRGVGVVLAILVGIVQIPGSVSSQLVRDSSALLHTGDLAGAEEYAVEAERAAPWAASPRAQEAIVAESAGDLSRAAELAREAIDRESLNWRHRILLARIELGRGDREAALESLREAVRLRAGDPQAIDADALIVLGRP